jgi:serine/threonine protein kinase
MKCRNCKFENPDDAVRCKNCGTALDEDTKPNSYVGTETVILDASTRMHVDPLSFTPGENFGDRYQIIEEIGQGGMGRVFKAKDTELDTVVALKMIKPQFSSDPDIVTRFKRELILAREILHEHVIRIHDLGEINGIKYISMNYIQGNTLKEILQSTGKLTTEKTIDLVKQVCSALMAAHSKGIIHRDLKPQNIMIDKSGKAYVLDFGIARSIHLDGEATEEGIVLGTPDFMSPEQIKGEKAEAGTDIYSLGIIMYEMATGELPFIANNHRELLYKHLNETPKPPTKLNPQIPLNLERIILKCLEKKKKNRYQAVEEILQDIEMDKTIEIPPVKVKPQKESRFLKPFLKVALRIFILLLIVYAAVSISSLVNDSIYEVKIEKLQVEYDTYYKNYFPLKKDWLPTQWESKDCNSWDTYLELFPGKKDNAPADSMVRKIGEISKNFNYNSDDDLKNIISNYARHFEYERLVDAVKCSQLDSRPTGEKVQMLYLPLVHRWADMIALKARVDFGEGNYEQGLTKLYHFMIFSLDLFTASTHIQEEHAALCCFNKMCREIIPLLLSRDPGSHSLPPYKAECLAAFGNFKEGLLPVTYDSPPEEEKIVLPILQSIESLIDAALNKFEPHSIFYKEYLNLVKNYSDIYASTGMGKSDYHLYGKLRFWEQWFSINRYFYKQGIEFYQGLFERTESIRNINDKSNSINAYFNQHTANKNIIVANAPRSMFALNAARTLGKLVLIVHNSNSNYEELRGDHGESPLQINRDI